MTDGPLVIGGYTLVERIAVGQIAEVYTARRQRSEPLVCLKRIRPDVLDKVELREAFQQEMALARQLRHPNIVEVYDEGEDDGEFFVMERVDGWTLGALLDRVGTLDPRDVAYLGASLCHAFVYLHHSEPETEGRAGRGPIAHCDVSPSNIFVRRNGAVKLADFGLAKVLPHTGAELLTRSRGQPRYYAPEQWLGEKLGAKTDLFALGLVLWHALIGHHPYAEGKPLGRQRGRVMLDGWIRQRTIQNQRRSVADAAPRAPAPLQGLVERLLQPFDARIATAEDVLDVLMPLASLRGDAELAARIAAKGAS